LAFIPTDIIKTNKTTITIHLYIQPKNENSNSTTLHGKL